MAVPDDADTVLKTVRLGWCVAEVRGRYRLNGQPGAGLALPDRTDDEPLPLQVERDSNELRVQALTVLDALARDLGVDTDPDNPGKRFPDEVKSAGESLSGASEDDRDAAWKNVAALIYRFDSYVQNTLAEQPITVGCGYQLGRAVGESYWALNPGEPSTPETWTSWSFLLGPERCNEIGRLLGRLTAYFRPYTAASIAGSLQVWQSVATDQNWQQTIAADERWRASAGSALYRQSRRWYELILLDQDPSTLIQPYQLLRDPGLVWRAARLFWNQLVLAGLAVVAIAFFAYLVPRPHVSSWIPTLLGVIGITGFSVAGLGAALKNDAQAMITRIKEDAYTDLIAVAITVAPPLPRTGAPPDASADPRPVSSMRQAQITRIVRRRTITPVTSA